MLWFRSGVVGAAGGTLALSIIELGGVLLMCLNPANGRDMKIDPYYNGQLGFYMVVIVGQVIMVAVCLFGLLLAFRVWRNNNQLDHSLRQLFSMWLALTVVACLVNFVMGVLGMIHYREPQEETMSLFEIFAKYNQDVKFVGSFERYQRENSCCGINGPDDWMMAQFKSGGGGAGGAMGGGGMDSFMGSPSTGKCHLTPPTIPMGCGKKLIDEIYWTKTTYSAMLLLETMLGGATAALGWYCFFYWIEKEVIIIPEDEVSNLIVIEPESSESEYTTVTDYTSRSGSRFSVAPTHYSSGPSRISGSRRSSLYSSGKSSGRTSGSLSSSGRNSSRSSSQYQSYRKASQLRPTYPERIREADEYQEFDEGNGYRNGNFEPNATRTKSRIQYNKISNSRGAVPSIGGPHSAYLSMEMIDPNDAERAMYQNTLHPQQRSPRSISEALEGPRAAGRRSAGSESIRLHQVAPSVVYNYKGGLMPPQDSPPLRSLGLLSSSYSTRRTVDSEDTTYESSSDSLSIQPAQPEKIRPRKQVKKVKSKLHMLHKQEKALGGKVLVEMRIDHSRDPDMMNSEMSVASLKPGHRIHHATLALVKNKHPPKPQQLFRGPQPGHGQTGHLANDILAMSGGAGAAKSMIDNVYLPVEHDPTLINSKGGYLRKLRKNSKKNDHPDKDHPGHGPVEERSGMVAAPAADGSQAQMLIDNIFNKGKTPKKKPTASQEVLIVPHAPSKTVDEAEIGAVAQKGRHGGKSSLNGHHSHSHRGHSSHHPHSHGGNSSQRHPRSQGGHHSHAGGRHGGHSTQTTTEILFKSDRPMD